MQGRTLNQRPWLYETATDVYQVTNHKKYGDAILRSLERPESWLVAAKKVKNSAVVRIRIFGLEERLIVKQQ